MVYLVKYIITAALPYAYSIPHLGNFVGSILPADVYFKYLNLKGEDAIFICGSDQHGTPIELKAIQAKKSPEELSEEMHRTINELFAGFECSFTHYGKTHSEKNKEEVYEIFNALKEGGYIKEVERTQAYCNFDKRFLIDRLIEGTCPYCGYKSAKGDQCDNCGKVLDAKDLISPMCMMCGRSDISFLAVKALAIALDKLEKEIKSFIMENSKNNWPKTVTNKSLSFISSGLQPRDITRNMSWGFKVPEKGFEDSVFYVWFDALIGYIGITREWDEKRWKDYWISNETKLIQFMGKDNLEFHAVMWPGMLIGSGLGFALPTTLKASEYLTFKSMKFSKSKGTGIDLRDALRILDADYWRFALMYLYPETADTDFSFEMLQEIVNSIMNDKIGNLVQRVFKLCYMHKETISEGMMLEQYRPKIDEIIEQYKDRFEKLELREALRSLIGLAELGNQIVSESKPWELAGSDNESFSRIMNTLKEIVYDIGILIYPFSPNASRKILESFSIDKEPNMGMLLENIRINLKKDPEPIFRKIKDKDIQQELQDKG